MWTSCMGSIILPAIPSFGNVHFNHLIKVFQFFHCKVTFSLTITSDFYGHSSLGLCQYSIFINFLSFFFLSSFLLVFSFFLSLLIIMYYKIYFKIVIYKVIKQANKQTSYSRLILYFFLTPFLESVISPRSSGSLLVESGI